MRRPESVLRVGLIGALLGACSPPPPTLVPVPEPGSVVGSLFLIGDAGAAKPNDPVLASLTRAAGETPANSTIVFLGDNVYPSGLPDSTAPDRAQAESRLDRQVAVARESGARTVFVPGNHDWARGAAHGWASVRRQADFVRARGDGRAVVLPEGGCPGPVTDDVPGDLRLVLLDSQWWLHSEERPEAGTSACSASDSSAFVATLRQALAGAGHRDVVVLSHHPYRSHGIHGGHFGILEHLFPLRELEPWLWVPLPIIGSAYPIARQNGISAQDMSNGKYRRWLGTVTGAIAVKPPTIYAAGHDHSLQVLSDTLIPTVVVSGAGYYNHRDPVGRGEDTRFAASKSGYVRVDRLKDGRLRLGVIVVDAKGAREEYSEWLDK